MPLGEHHVCGLDLVLQLAGCGSGRRRGRIIRIGRICRLGGLCGIGRVGRRGRVRLRGSLGDLQGHGGALFQFRSGSGVLIDNGASGLVAVHLGKAAVELAVPEGLGRRRQALPRHVRDGGGQNDLGPLGDSQRNALALVQQRAGGGVLINYGALLRVAVSFRLAVIEFAVPEGLGRLLQRVPGHVGNGYLVGVGIQNLFGNHLVCQRVRVPAGFVPQIDKGIGLRAGALDLQRHLHGRQRLRFGFRLRGGGHVGNVGDKVADPDKVLLFPVEVIFRLVHGDALPLQLNVG